ncbi:MAG: AMP-binding protein, partial [Pseudomonadota bacterium]
MATEALDSFPKLLARNAKEFATKPASRVKEFGIWQSWTWAEMAQEIDALALGLMSLGLKAGDHVAIVGTNRPQLYWSMVAIQSCGAVPVPVYQDSVAEEMAYVLEHCGARFVIAEDQEHVDKVLEIAERLPLMEHLIYLDPRGLRKYDHSKMTSYRDVQEAGRQSGQEA